MLRSSILLVVLACAGCSHEPRAGESIAEVCRPAQDGRTVAVSGYLVAPLLTVPCEESCSLYVSRAADERDGVFVHFPVGTGAGTMDAIRTDPNAIGASLPGVLEPLDARQFVVRDHRGRALSLGDVVRVRGTVYVSQGPERIDCSMRASRIEAL